MKLYVRLWPAGRHGNVKLWNDRSPELLVDSYLCKSLDARETAASSRMLRKTVCPDDDDLLTINNDAYDCWCLRSDVSPSG